MEDFIRFLIKLYYLFVVLVFYLHIDKWRRSYICVRFIIIYSGNIKYIIVKVTSFCRTIFSYSAVHLHLDISFPWLLGYIRKLAFETPRAWKLVHSQSTYGAQEHQTCTDTALSRYQFHLVRMDPR